MSEPRESAPREDSFSHAINEAGVKQECPRCEAVAWKVLEGDYAFIKTLTDPTDAGGPGIPCAVAICTACGFVAMHALGFLEV